MYSGCTLLKVVSYYDLSALSMSVMGFQKKFGWGGGWVGAWGKLYPSLVWIFLTLQNPLLYSRVRPHCKTTLHQRRLKQRMMYAAI